VLLGLFLVPRVPEYCVPQLACRTLSAKLTGRRVEMAPVFHNAVFTPLDRERKWREYEQSIAYLREKLPQGFAVVNGLDPFGDFAGLTVVFPSKRRSISAANPLLVPSFPTRIFEQSLRMVAEDPKTAIVLSARQLAAHRPAGAAAAEKLDRWQTLLVRTLNERYQPAARFGAIEIWVHKQELVPSQVAEKDRGVLTR
jgi:hypothetical protein